MLHHLLPNLVPQVAANGALVVDGAIYTETALSFLGLGDPLQPTWGICSPSLNALAPLAPVLGGISAHPAYAC
ncbi:hypothetical protein ACWTU6_31235 [Mesorhizobium sp. BHbsci]